MRPAMQEVKFVIPKELAERVLELAKRCGVPPVNVACVGLKMVTDIADDTEGGGLKFLQERAPLLKPENVN